MTVAVRVVVPGLADAVNVIKALFDPDPLLNVNHVWLLDVVHAVFDTILNVFVLFAGAPIVKAVVETVKNAVLASCVTVII